MQTLWISWNPIALFRFFFTGDDISCWTTFKCLRYPMQSANRKYQPSIVCDGIKLLHYFMFVNYNNYPLN